METSPATGDVDRSRPVSRPHRPIPDYLQPFIVEQEMGRYTAIDQAVWRFVLLELHDRLKRTAHPSYVRGLAQSAISPDHIPSIEEMDRALASIGWSAVCVDGFIPPRAFQAFQSLGILPIAAEIRTPDHLPYTPAPDIIHEAAGHAPILVDPSYAAYVRAIGDVGASAFASPEDDRIDRAVRVLSELKENPESDAALAAAELELERAVAAARVPSEAARVARLYWWTAEYGLVGTPRDYRLYGAGLLSSLGESHFCHRPEVSKLVLSPECTLMGYDITRPQPQLYVARDFDHLHAVLAEVRAGLAFAIGGEYAVEAALRSAELCTVQYSGGAQVIGTPNAAGSAGSQLMRFEPGAALADQGRLLGRVPHALAVASGPLSDGSDPRLLSADPARWCDASGRLSVEYASGLRLGGVPSAGPFVSAGVLLWLRELSLEWRGERITHHGPYPWLCVERVATARAGSASPAVSPLEPSAGALRARSRPKVPKLKARTPAGVRLAELYAEVQDARHGRGGAGPRHPTYARLSAVHTEGTAAFPHEWLLYWNVLEALLELGFTHDPLVERLERRLRGLEEHYGGQHPIALGLDYLAARR